MEIKTCEQYVLDQLDVHGERGATNYVLKARCARARIAQLKARDERETSKVEQDIRKEGRAKLYRDGTGYRTSVSSGGSLIPFEDWCMEHVGYLSQRCGMTKAEFIVYFEPEFRAEYEEHVRRVEGGAGMIGIYERSLCQSYASAYRAGHPARQDRRRGRGRFRSSSR